jgi:hypothetical protein
MSLRGGTTKQSYQDHEAGWHDGMARGDCHATLV